MLELLKGSTSVELKLMVQDTDHRAAVKGLRFDPVEAEPRQVYFFDTPDLALDKAGVVVRARRIQGGGADTVVKLRPVEPETIDTELRRVAGFKIELDAMPGGYVCSASYKGACTGQEVLDVMEGRLPRVKYQPKDFNRRVTVELWLYPDGSRVFEISTKCRPDEAFQVAVEFRAFLGKCGVVAEPSDKSKTKGALEFFSREILSERKR